MGFDDRTHRFQAVVTYPKELLVPKVNYSPPNTCGNKSSNLLHQHCEFLGKSDWLKKGFQ